MDATRWIKRERWRRAPLWQKILGFVIILGLALARRLPELAALRPWLIFLIVATFGALAALFYTKVGPEQRRRKRAALQEALLEPVTSQEHGMVLPNDESAEVNRSAKS